MFFCSQVVLRLPPSQPPPLALPEQRSPPRGAGLSRAAPSPRHPRVQPQPGGVRVRSAAQPHFHVPHGAQGEERLNRVQGGFGPGQRDRLVLQGEEDQLDQEPGSGT